MHSEVAPIILGAPRVRRVHYGSLGSLVEPLEVFTYIRGRLVNFGGYQVVFGFIRGRSVHSGGA